MQVQSVKELEEAEEAEEEEEDEEFYSMPSPNVKSKAQNNAEKYKEEKAPTESKVINIQESKPSPRGQEIQKQPTPEK